MRSIILRISSRLSSIFFFFRLTFHENAEKRESRVHILQSKIIRTNINVIDECEEKNLTSNLI